MSQRVPLAVEQTGDEKVDRNLYNVAQAVRQLQEASNVPQSISTNVSISLAKQTIVIVLSTTLKPVTISLPNVVPLNQAVTIRNNSTYPVSVRTADATTVLTDVAPGASSVVVANGSSWSNG